MHPRAASAVGLPQRPWLLQLLGLFPAREEDRLGPRAREPLSPASLVLEPKLRWVPLPVCTGSFWWGSRSWHPLCTTVPGAVSAPAGLPEASETCRSPWCTCLMCQ